MYLSTQRVSLFWNSELLRTCFDTEGNIIFLKTLGEYTALVIHITNDILMIITTSVCYYSHFWSVFNCMEQ